MIGKEITISELQHQAAHIATKIGEDRKPILVTQRGRVRLVLLDIESFKELEKALRRLEALELQQLVDEGRKAYAEGRLVPHADIVDEVARRRSKRPGRAALKRKPRHT